jgi:hypothetical protein
MCPPLFCTYPNLFDRPKEKDTTRGILPLEMDAEEISNQVTYPATYLRTYVRTYVPTWWFLNVGTYVVAYLPINVFCSPTKA